MNRNLTLLTALGASLATAPVILAQAAPATPAAAPAAVAPVATNAKIALVNFEQVVLASNEGQTATIATQKKFEPKKAQIESQAAEVETLKKNLQSAPATLADDERASRLRAIDTKEKALNRDAEDAQTSYNTELQEALGKVAQKLAAVMKTYAQTNGYTILLDVSSQSSNVLWALPSTDVSQAVVDAYNKQFRRRRSPAAGSFFPASRRRSSCSQAARQVTEPFQPANKGGSDAQPSAPSAFYFVRWVMITAKPGVQT